MSACVVLAVLLCLGICCMLLHCLHTTRLSPLHWLSFLPSSGISAMVRRDVEGRQAEERTKQYQKEEKKDKNIWEEEKISRHKRVVACRRCMRAHQAWRQRDQAGRSYPPISKSHFLHCTAASGHARHCACRLPVCACCYCAHHLIWEKGKRA